MLAGLLLNLGHAHPGSKERVDRLRQDLPEETPQIKRDDDDALAILLAQWLR